MPIGHGIESGPWAAMVQNLRASQQVTLGGPPSGKPCKRRDGLIDNASKTAASIFMGQVIAVSEPREVTIGFKTEKLYVTKFFVWERWKGPKSLEAEVLTEMPFHWGLPQMRVGSVFLVFAFPVSIPDGSSNIEGIVTHNSPTTFFTDLAYIQMFELDRIFKPKVTQRTYLFAPPPQPRKFCLVCCID